jgi:imidazolonepropionase-like amidohydrolase
MPLAYRRSSHAGFWLILACVLVAHTLRAQDAAWVLTNVHIVDVEGGRILLGRNIHVRGDRMMATGANSSHRSLPELHRIDGGGAFVIPGLYDMHVHVGMTGVVDDSAFTRRVREGVVGVRDMGFPLDSLPVLSQLSRRSRDGPVGRPGVWYVGPTLNAPSTMSFPQHLQVADSAAVDSAVVRIAAAGATAIKIHDRLSRDAYEQVTRAARAVGLPVVGHLPASVPIVYIIKARQRSVEHFGGLTHGILMACSRDASARQRVAAVIVPHDFPRLYQLTMSAAHLTPLLDGFDAERCAVLARRLRAADSWQVPTLTMWKVWATTVPDSQQMPSAADLAVRRRLYRTILNVTRLFFRQHVPLMAGTDELGSIHDELAALVDAGLAPADALRAATVQPARFLGTVGSRGAVKPGYIADFVLLEGNPLIDIHNSRRVVGVVLGGGYRNVGVSRSEAQ